MTDVEWSEAGDEPPQKKGGIPKWVWFGCGGGCLLVLILVAAMTIFGVMFVQDAMDPEKQWPKLQKLLPHEERPTDLEMAVGIPIPGIMDQFVLKNEADGYIATIMNLKVGGASDFDEMFSVDPQGTPFGLGAPVEPEAGELDVQGHSVRTLRFRTVKGQGMAGELGAGIRVDLSETGQRVMIEFRRTGSKEPLSNEELTAFFANFDVWGDD